MRTETQSRQVDLKENVSSEGGRNAKDKSAADHFQLILKINCLLQPVDS